MSKELEATSGCNLQKKNSVSVTEMLSGDRIDRMNIVGIEEKVAKLNSNSDITGKYVETVNQFVKLHKGSSALIFTDGSVCSGSVGSGACAAVLHPLLDPEETGISTNAVGKKVSSSQCEIEGIILGIELAIHYLKTCQSGSDSGRIFVFCDCDYAIDAVDRKLESVRYPDIFKRLTDVQAQLKATDKYVSLVCIPGHSGITGNYLANENSRKLAQSIASGNTDAADEIVANEME